jgi:hypothetical protein
MPVSEPLIDTPRALDEAIAASRGLRRDRLERAIRSHGLRAGLVFGMSGCIGLCAPVALFVAHDRAAAAVIALMAVSTFAFAYVAWRFGRNKALDELQEFDQTPEV